MGSGVAPKLVGWDAKLDFLLRVIYLPAPIAPNDAFVNDFTVDSRHNRIFIVDRRARQCSQFIVVEDIDPAAGDPSARVLEGHQSVGSGKVRSITIMGSQSQMKDAKGHWVRPRAVGVDPDCSRRFAERMGLFWPHARNKLSIASRRALSPMKNWNAATLGQWSSATATNRDCERN